MGNLDTELHARDVAAFKARVQANVLANKMRRQASWDKRDAYFAAKDKLVAFLKGQGFEHTHGKCVVCDAIAKLQEAYK